MKEEIEKLLRKTFASQYKDDFQQGKIALACQIADIIGYETEEKAQ